MTDVALRIVNNVSYVTRISHDLDPMRVSLSMATKWH